VFDSTGRDLHEEAEGNQDKHSSKQQTGLATSAIQPPIL
jgi:hypothetical protein